MEIHYQSKKLEKQLTTSTGRQKAFGTRAKRLSQRITEIEASPNLAVLMQIPAANCHALEGDRGGDWALDITGNWRLIFDLGNCELPRKEEDGEIDYSKIAKLIINNIEDYH
jgi:plasmid maintenance system killer protein